MCPSKRKPNCECIDERCPRRHVAKVGPMLGRKSTDSTTYYPRVGARAAAIEMLLELSNTQTWTQGFTVSIERSPTRRSRRPSEYSLIGSQRGRPEQSRSKAQEPVASQLIRKLFNHFAIEDFVFTQMPRGLAISRFRAPIWANFSPATSAIQDVPPVMTTVLPFMNAFTRSAFSSKNCRSESEPLSSRKWGK
jgi:hypothetical protein